MILDLKRITEKQLKEIVMLQKEIEIVKYNSNGVTSFNNTRRGGKHDSEDGWQHSAADPKSPKRSKQIIKTL